jgi:hypothetical protein
MGNNWQAAADDDGLSGFPSPVNQLGDIDPDEARANPELMARLTGNPSAAKERIGAGPGAVNRVGDPRRNGAPPPSVIAAGRAGSAGAVPNDPTDSGNTFNPIYSLRASHRRSY